MTTHQVYLAHMIDEQYFFADLDDARWFWLEGYKRCLYVDKDGVTVMPYERMTIWIHGEEVDERSYGTVEIPGCAVDQAPTHSDMTQDEKAAKAAHEATMEDSERRLGLQIISTIGDGNYSTPAVLRALATAAAEITGVASMPDCGRAGHLPPDAMVEELAGMLHTWARDFAYAKMRSVDGEDENAI
jgi:hypothetical protein